MQPQGRLESVEEKELPLTPRALLSITEDTVQFASTYAAFTFPIGADAVVNLPLHLNTESWLIPELFARGGREIRPWVCAVALDDRRSGGHSDNSFSWLIGS